MAVVSSVHLTDRSRMLLARTRWNGSHEVVCREAILEADERITVMGAGVREADPDKPSTGLYRDGGHTRLRITGTAKYPLLISDDPRSL